MSERLEQIVAQHVSALGLDLEAVEKTGSGKYRKLVVAVDSDTGVGIDEITQVSRALSEALDDTDLMGTQPYTLEVTSRGVNRPLTEPRHWRRNAGRLVKATLTDGSTVSGRIGASDDTGVELDIRGAVQRLAYADLSDALVQIELRK